MVINLPLESDYTEQNSSYVCILIVQVENFFHNELGKANLFY